MDFEPISVPWSLRPLTYLPITSFINWAAWALMVIKKVAADHHPMEAWKGCMWLDFCSLLAVWVSWWEQKLPVPQICSYFLLNCRLCVCEFVCGHVHATAHVRSENNSQEQGFVPAEPSYRPAFPQYFLLSSGIRADHAHWGPLPACSGLESSVCFIFETESCRVGFELTM